jgi:16S rRNA processing protein RimM
MPTTEQRQSTDPARQPPAFLAVGRILRPHGIRGALLVDPISEQLLGLKPGSQVHLGPDHTPMTFVELRRHGGRWLLWLEGINRREEADSVRGQDIALPLSDLPPLPDGTFYHWQIIGLMVRSDTGEVLGKVSEILTTGANDVYVVRDDAGRELLLPAIESVVLEVRLYDQEMVVHLIPGLRE